MTKKQLKNSGRARYVFHWTHKILVWTILLYILCSFWKVCRSNKWQGNLRFCTHYLCIINYWLLVLTASISIHLNKTVMCVCMFVYNSKNYWPILMRFFSLDCKFRRKWHGWIFFLRRQKNGSFFAKKKRTFWCFSDVRMQDILKDI